MALKKSATEDFDREFQLKNDYCGKDVEKLKEAIIRERDKEEEHMLGAINDHNDFFYHNGNFVAYTVALRLIDHYLWK